MPRVGYALPVLAGDYRIVDTYVDRRVVRLVYLSRRGRLGALAWRLLLLVGVDVPRAVQIGAELRLPHSTNGLVLHPHTRIGERVTLWHHVTVGRGDVWLPPTGEGGVTIGNDAILGAGARVLFKNGQNVTLGEGAVIGANAVVTENVPPWEIWAGNPARKVGDRPHYVRLTPEKLQWSPPAPESFLPRWK